MSDVQLICGDCLDVLPTLANGSVDAIVTDPPYGHNNTICRMIDQRDRWAKAWKRSAKIESELAAAKEEISTLKAQIAILAG